MLRNGFVLLLMLTLATPVLASDGAQGGTGQSGASSAKTHPGLAPPAPFMGGAGGGYSCDSPEPAVLSHPRCRQWLAEYAKWRAAYDAYHEASNGD